MKGVGGSIAALTCGAVGAGGVSIAAEEVSAAYAAAAAAAVAAGELLPTAAAAAFASAATMAAAVAACVAWAACADEVAAAGGNWLLSGVPGAAATAAAAEGDMSPAKFAFSVAAAAAAATAAAAAGASVPLAAEPDAAVCVPPCRAADEDAPDMGKLPAGSGMYMTVGAPPLTTCSGSSGMNAPCCRAARVVASTDSAGDSSKPPSAVCCITCSCGCSKITRAQTYAACWIMRVCAGKSVNVAPDCAMSFW